MERANCYGLHWQGAIAWLVQGRGSSNFLGLKSTCPWSRPSWDCNHLVPVNSPVPDGEHLARFYRLIEDPLVQAMLPIPRGVDERGFYLEDPEDLLGHHIATLSRMSSPIFSRVKPAWQITPGELEKQARASNIQPWVIPLFGQKDQQLLTQIAEGVSYSPRTTILAGAGHLVIPKSLTRIQSKLLDINLKDLITLPWESLGAAYLRKYARKEA